MIDSARELQNDLISFETKFKIEVKNSVIAIEKNHDLSARLWVRNFPRGACGTAQLAT